MNTGNNFYPSTTTPIQVPGNISDIIILLLYYYYYKSNSIVEVFEFQRAIAASILHSRLLWSCMILMLLRNIPTIETRHCHDIIVYYIEVSIVSIRVFTEIPMVNDVSTIFFDVVFICTFSL